MTMTIKLINPPGSTGRGSVVGMDDTRLGFFPEKAALFEGGIGKTFEIEYIENDRNGKTLRNVKSAKQVAAASPPAQQSTSASRSNGNLNGHYRPTSPEDSERMFVCSLMNAFIRAGKIEPEQVKVINAINVLRTAYQKTFGFDDRTFTPSQAGHHHIMTTQ